jgi:hypothetical protein
LPITRKWVTDFASFTPLALYLKGFLAIKSKAPADEFQQALSFQQVICQG